MCPPFDPSAPAPPGSGAFGLDPDPDAAGVHLFPVPVDATASYRRGAAQGPEAIRLASQQIDLYDVETGRPYEHGIWMAPSPSL